MQRPFEAPCWETTLEAMPKNQTALETKCTNAAWNARDDAQQICLKQWEKKQIAKKTQQFLVRAWGRTNQERKTKHNRSDVVGK